VFVLQRISQNAVKHEPLKKAPHRLPIKGCPADWTPLKLYSPLVYRNNAMPVCQPSRRAGQNPAQEMVLAITLSCFNRLVTYQI
jgi:hypothetical protein